MWLAHLPGTWQISGYAIGWRLLQLTAAAAASGYALQGVQVVHGRPIIYGAGGFIDDYPTEEEYR